MKPHEATEYWNMIARGGYYRWNALKGMTLPGNDPITGSPRNQLPRRLRETEESRTAYKAMSKFWYTKAKTYRLSKEV